MLHAPCPLMCVPAPGSSLLLISCQRFLGQAYVALLPQVYHLGGMRQALALRIFRLLRQLPPSIRRIIIDVRTDDIR